MGRRYTRMYLFVIVLYFYWYPLFVKLISLVSFSMREGVRPIAVSAPAAATESTMVLPRLRLLPRRPGQRRPQRRRLHKDQPLDASSRRCGICIGV